MWDKSIFERYCSRQGYREIKIGYISIFERYCSRQRYRDKTMGDIIIFDSYCSDRVAGKGHSRIYFFKVFEQAEIRR